jgi:hypothetical protein
LQRGLAGLAFTSLAGAWLWRRRRPETLPRRGIHTGAR